MKALKLKQNSVELVEAVKPEIDNQADLLIEVSRAGICGTDLHIIDGHFDANQGVILGHEAVGKVVGVGKDAKGFKVGDVVVVNPHGACGDCYWCDRSCPHFCTKKALDASLGMRRDGAFAKYTLAPSENCYALPSGVTHEEAVLVEPYSCIMHAIDQGSPVEEHHDVLVLGAGIIGILATILLSHRKIKNVTVMELIDHRRNTVDQMKLPGVKTCHPDALKQENSSHAADPTYGFDRVFDFTGAVPAIQLGFDSLRKKGKLVLFGVMKKDAEAKLHLHDILFKEVEITGALTNPGSLQPALEAIQSLAAAGKLDLKALDIRQFDLEEFKEAFELLKAGKISKAMFDLSKQP